MLYGISHCYKRVILVVVQLVFLCSVAAQDRALDHAIAARRFFEDGDQKRALMAYSKAISLDQIKPEYYYERGRVKRNIGKPGGAAVDFEIAVTFDGKFKEAWFQLGLASYEASRFDDALRALNMTLFIDSKDAEAWHWRGCTLTALGREESAIRSLTQATRMNPESADCFLHLGRANARAGKLQEAVLAFSKAVSLEAKNPELYCARALAQLQYAAAAPKPQTFLTAAAADLAEARAASPTFPEVLALTALHHWLSGNTKATLKSLEKGLKAVPPRHAVELRLRAWAVAATLGDKTASAKHLQSLPKQAVTDKLRRWIDVARATRAPSVAPRYQTSLDDQQVFAYYAGVKALSTGDAKLAKVWLAKAADRGHSIEALAARLALKRLAER